MKVTLFLLGLPTLGLAYPGLMGTSSKEDTLKMLEKAKREADAAELEKRQSLSGLAGSLVPSVSSLVSDVAGLLGSVASSVDPDNYRPEPGYTYQAPGPNDSRGPCPGLNLLANHGYLPRNGHVTYVLLLDRYPV